MAIFTLSKNYIEGVCANDSQLHNVILKFANPDSPHKAAMDKSKVLYKVYVELSKTNNDLQTWLDWMSRAKESKFEIINIDLSNINCEEEIYLKLASATNKDKKVIVNSHQFWSKFVYLPNSSKISYNGCEIEILDKTEALKELTTQNKNLTIINNNMAEKNNPWKSGIFYLFILIIIMSLLAAIAHLIPWYLLPVIFIGSILLLGIVGAFQLKNDNQLSEKNFLELMKETYKRLPLLKNTNKDSQ